MRLLFKGSDYSREASNQRNTVTSKLVPIFRYFSRGCNFFGPVESAKNSLGKNL